MKNIFVNNNKPMKKEKEDKKLCIPKKIKILFVLKKKMNYGISNSAPYGLKTSCSLVAKCLEPYGITSKIVQVIDGNCVNKEIHDFKPNFVIFEAIWCPPYKIEELVRLYPQVIFNVRIHSKVQFLAQERMAFEWLNLYKEISKKYSNFSISGNSNDFIEQVNCVLGFNSHLLPNCYPMDSSIKQDKKEVGKIFDVGCFGALRILKNQLLQAICAIHFADQSKRILRFHINDSSTFEREGNPIIYNLINVFKPLKHELVIHEWIGHNNFLELIRTMDVGMQVSFNETYNIVAADMVAAGIPVVGSPEIPFLSSSYQADPNSFDSIVDKLRFAVFNKWLGLHKVNELKLRNDSNRAIKIWLDFLHH